MGATVQVIWDDGFAAYDFGEGHPMTPLRLELTARLCEAFGLFDLPDVEVVAPSAAGDEVLSTVHEPGYIAAVKAASLDPRRADQRRGLGTEDDPAFAGMHEASARLAGSLEPHLVPVAGRERRDVLRLDHTAVATLVGMGPHARHLAAGIRAGRIAALPEPVDVTVAVRVAAYRRR